MSDAESLDSILSGSSSFSPATTDVKAASAATAPSAGSPAPQAAEPAKAEPAKVEPAAKVEVPRDESGKFTKAEKPEPMVPLSALLAERAKRKEAAPPESKVSVFDDEDKGIAQRVDERISPVNEQIFNLSVELARTQHADFDEVAASFAEFAEKDSRLWDSMRAARNPALYVYQVGRQMRELADVGGDIVKYGEKKSEAIRGELTKEKELHAATKAQLETLQKQLAELQALPTSLNTKSAAPNPRAVVDQDDDSITSIVRFGNSK